MAVETIRESTVRNAVDKALKVQPQLLELCEGFHVAPSASHPGRGYMLEVVDGKVSCECEGYERMGCCYHAAALAIQLGLMPHRYLVPEASPLASDTAVLRQAPKGRTALWA